MKRMKMWNGREMKAYIYENDLVEYILEEIGCEHIAFHGKYWSCNNPDGDNQSAVNIKNNAYLGVKNWTREHEYEEDADIISFVMNVKHLSFRQTMEYLVELVRIYENDESKRKKTTKVVQTRGNGITGANAGKQIILDERILDRYEPIGHASWIREGILEKTRAEFGIRYSLKEEAIIIPLRHWQTGELLGINKRTVREDYAQLGIPKYRLSSGYPKQINMYGLYENRKSILKAGYVVVYESEKSVLKRHSQGDETGIALSGHSMSEEQASILLNLDVDIVISMDKDISEEEVKQMCQTRLYGRTNKNIYYTVDHENVLGEKESVADKSGEVFDRIMKDKVLYCPCVDSEAYA